MRLAFAAIAIALGLLAQEIRAADVYAVRGPWVDEHETSYSMESLRGTYTVVTMAYGACRRVCSTSIRVVQQLAERAERRHLKLNLLVVGLAPDEDKPADWAALRDKRKPDFEKITFLTGTEASTRRLARSLGVQYWRYGEHIMHDFRVVLISPDGEVIESIDRFDQDQSVLLPDRLPRLGQ